MVHHNFLKNCWKETNSGQCLPNNNNSYQFIFIESGVFYRREARADLKCEGKEHSDSGKMIIDLDIVSVTIIVNTIFH